MEKINWDEWEECSCNEAYKDIDKHLRIYGGDEDLFFKRKAKTVFEDKNRKVEITHGYMRISAPKLSEEIDIYPDQIHLIFDAVDEWRRRWGK